MDPQSPLQPYSPPSDGGISGQPPLPPQPPQFGPATPLNVAAPYPSQAFSPAPSAPPANVGFGSQPGLAGNFGQPQYPAISPATSATFGQPTAPPLGAPMQPPSQAAPQRTPKNEVVERLKTSNNVLVTVSNNPSVDQLSAAIGLTVLLNKLDKHAAAVFSGQVPSTLEFLQPEKTLEKNTDSLRDFIIALDKAKADKLRYKVEDKFVKIFITPYHTSLGQDDLEFSQGDFNVDIVIALGVHRKEELDEAITAHGRILHDATVVCVNNLQTAELGTINWFDQDASSLCEMLIDLIEPLQGKQALLDSQVATAFLTGIVAETERFSNDATSPRTMNVSAILMKAGANQQLVATKLAEPEDIQEATSANDVASKKAAKPNANSDGSLEVEHPHMQSVPTSNTLAEMQHYNSAVPVQEDEPESNLEKIHIDEHGRMMRMKEMREEEERAKQEGAAKSQEGTNQTLPDQPSQLAPNHMVMQPPSMGGALSANLTPPGPPVNSDPLDVPPSPMAASLSKAKSLDPLPDIPTENQTLEQIEQAVDSPHIDPNQAARQALDTANREARLGHVQPPAAFNAMPLELGKPIDGPEKQEEKTSEEVFPPQVVKPDKGLPPDPTAGNGNPAPPPPVPPPLVPPQIS